MNLLRFRSVNSLFKLEYNICNMICCNSIERFCIFQTIVDLCSANRPLSWIEQLL